MNPLYCPFCGSLYLIWHSSRDGDGRIYSCRCGGSWRTEYQGEREVPVETYPPTNLLSEETDDE
jgi:hypothetical protein